MPTKLKILKLNLGSGTTKLDGFVNIDTEPSVNPDKVCNFIKDALPYKDNTVNEVALFHTIEHISKMYHSKILNEIWRVLKPGGTFILSYPEFLNCVHNWKNNHRGLKTFWEATIYGRQLYPSDFHVCIMHTPDFTEVLQDCGFININSKPEPVEAYNTVVVCTKSSKVPKYEDLIRSDMKK